MEIKQARSEQKDFVPIRGRGEAGFIRHSSCFLRQAETCLEKEASYEARSPPWALPVTPPADKQLHQELYTKVRDSFTKVRVIHQGERLIHQGERLIRQGGLPAGDHWGSFETLAVR